MSQQLINELCLYLGELMHQLEKGKNCLEKSRLKKRINAVQFLLSISSAINETDDFKGFM